MPEGEFDTPGPFYRDGVMVFRRTGKHQHMFARLTTIRDEAEMDEFIGLLNKGTHYNGMLEALKAIRSAADERSGDFQADIDGLVAAWVLVDDAIAAAAGGKERGAG